MCGFKDGYHIDIVLRDSFLNQFISDKKDELLIRRSETIKEPIVLRYGISSDAESDPAIVERITTLSSFIQKLANLNGVSVEF